MRVSSEEAIMMLYVVALTVFYPGDPSTVFSYDIRFDGEDLVFWGSEAYTVQRCLLLVSYCSTSCMKMLFI